MSTLLQLKKFVALFSGENKLSAFQKLKFDIRLKNYLKNKTLDSLLVTRVTPFLDALPHTLRSVFGISSQTFEYEFF